MGSCSSARPCRCLRPRPPRALETFTEQRETYSEREKFNQHHWLEHFEDFLEVFFGHIFSEPHSTKQIEDGIAWGLDTDPRTLILTILAPGSISPGCWS